VEKFTLILLVFGFKFPRSEALRYLIIQNQDVLDEKYKQIMVLVVELEQQLDIMFPILSPDGDKYI